MTAPAPLRLVVVSTVSIAAAYAGGFRPEGAPAWSPWLMLFGMATLLIALMALGARRPGLSLRPLALPLGITWLVLMGGLGLALLLPPESADDPLWLGLPRRAALVIYGIGLVPSAILPFAYARTFEQLTLRPEDLARVRAARARREGAA